MVRYRVVSYGGMDGLKFPDLLVRFSTGYLLPLSVREGEYVPVEILEPLDVKKSLLVGSLGRYIASGDVRAEDDPLPTVSLPTPQAQIPAEVVLPVIQEKVSSKEEVLVKPTETPTAPEEHITNFAGVSSVEDFFKLGYFLKLRFIKECSDRTLLETLLNRTDSKQLQNNIQLRLAQI